MYEISRMFHEGGAASYVVFGFAILTWGFACLALVPHVMKGSKQRIALLGLGSVIVICGLLALIAALAGWGYGYMQMERAVMMTAPEHIDKMRAKGSQMAFVPVKIWLVALPPFLFGILTLVRGFLIPKISHENKLK